MEIRNITPNASTSFGMALRKPDETTLRLMERVIPARDLKAFIKDQAKLYKYDIEITSDAESRLYGRIVPNYEQFTLYRTPPLKYYSSTYINHNKNITDEFAAAGLENINMFKEKHPKLAQSRIAKGIVRTKEFTKLLTKSLFTMAFNPKKLVPTELRKMGEYAKELEKADRKTRKNLDDIDKLLS